MILRLGFAVAPVMLGWLSLAIGQTQAAEPQPDRPIGYRGLAAPMEPGSNVEPFRHVRISIAKALDAIQKQGRGRVIEIGYVRKSGSSWYRVGILRAAGLRYQRASTVTGAVSRRKTQNIAFAAFDAEARQVLKAAGSAQFTLAQAIVATERTTGGKVISAGMEQIQGIPQYYVQAVAQGKFVAAVVDPNTGIAVDPSSE
jgi:uncharacterized membrane protein YkoI